MPHLDRAEQADVLAGCLRGGDSRAIASAVRQLWKSTGFHIAEFDAPPDQIDTRPIGRGYSLLSGECHSVARRVSSARQIRPLCEEFLRPD